MGNYMSDYDKLNQVLQNGQQITQFLPERIAVVDQAMELARLMKETNSMKEIGEVLTCAAETFKKFSTPIYIVKTSNEE